MATWQVQQAKARLTEVMDDAQTKGPQIITRHGAERAVVISIEDYRERFQEKPAEKPNFVDFLLGPPYLDEDDDFFEIMDTIQKERALDTGRDIDLDD